MPLSPIGSTRVASSASDPVRRPVIGLTTYLERAQQGVWNVRASFLPAVYFEAVTAVGGAAVLLPPQAEPEAAAASTLDGLDGLILTGGIDVDPALYGQERHELTDPARPDRDAWELALLAEARRRGVPVLGICRGLQLINVAFGGTLHQHLPEALGTERYRLGGGVFAKNTAMVEPGTLVADAVGAGPAVIDSYHHQGIDRLGAGLRVAARSDDGLVQAIESTGDACVVAVQWHPEMNETDRRLFAALTERARVFAGTHRAPADAAPEQEYA